MNRNTIKSSSNYIQSLLFLFLLSPFVLFAVTINDFTKGMDKHVGFLNYFWDTDAGKIYLTINSPPAEFLYVNSLATGVGSNDLSLDRGQLGALRVVYFERVGAKVFLRQPNLDYRAHSKNALEVTAVDDAFATSTLWGFDLVAQSKHQYLIDLTDFLLRDSHHIHERLSNRKQGQYKADKSRSSVYIQRTKNFPDNSEFEATLTLKGTKAGKFLRAVTPSSNFVTLRTHHSFIRLPDDDYQPRVFHPRTGQFFISYKDYSTPLGSDITKRLITRHRLEKKYPSKRFSEVIKPIIYYLDPATPEPVKSALMEGASWWKEAFEAAGFINAFQVKVLPADADPMDLRYNTIQWVHRSTRGWSYGDSIVDPRTGEILKGHVTLGSLRVRQDMLIAQGLTSPFKDGSKSSTAIETMALARLRQLAAHEVGHTLGLTHNFAASPSDRASVMDYPHPFVQISQQNQLELSDAYGEGIAEWDKLAIRYAYSEFSKQDEAQGLQNIVQKIDDSGIEFITDQDSRANSMAHPKASLWDNGSSATAELIRVLRIRKIALANLGQNSLKIDTPWSELEKLLVPIYLFHRYQSEATAKLLGGIKYDYSTRSNSTSSLEPQVTSVSANDQKAALTALLKTMSSETLTIPKRLVSLIPPPAYGFARDRENFDGFSQPAFDVLSAAETAASHTVKLLLDPKRCARLSQQKAINSNNLGVLDVQKSLIKESWKKHHKNTYSAAIQRSINSAVLKQMFILAASSEASSQVRAVTMLSLRDLETWLKKRKSSDTLQRASELQGAIDIEQFLNSDKAKQFSTTKKLPPGSPI